MYSNKFALSHIKDKIKIYDYIHILIVLNLIQELYVYGNSYKKEVKGKRLLNIEVDQKFSLIMNLIAYLCSYLIRILVQRWFFIRS